jgi:hypothetical protein
MKKMKSSGGAESTDFKGFGGGSKKGIPASSISASTGKTKGSTAKFSGGKKTVSK